MAFDMAAILSIVFFIAGVLLLLKFTRNLVQGLIGSIAVFGISFFTLSMLFGGIDIGNTIAGSIAVLYNYHSLAFGTTIGAAIFLLSVTLGVLAIYCPMEPKSPLNLIVLLLVMPLPLFLFTFDQVITRTEGAVLIITYLLITLIIYQLTKSKKLSIRSEHAADVKKKLKKEGTKHFLISLLIGLFGVSAGSWLMVQGAGGLVRSFRLSEHLFGFVFIGLAIGLPLIFTQFVMSHKKDPQSTLGNAVGILAYLFTANIGIIALIRPIVVSTVILKLHIPFLVAMLIITSAFIARRKIAKMEGIALITLYLIYLALNYMTF